MVQGSGSVAYMSLASRFPRAKKGTSWASSMARVAALMAAALGVSGWTPLCRETKSARVPLGARMRAAVG